MNVVIRDGKPAMIRTKRRSLRVREVLDVWRMDEEWKQGTTTGLYFLLEFDSGMRLTLFYDREKGGWYRQSRP
jgi:hypothetical protein